MSYIAPEMQARILGTGLRTESICNLVSFRIGGCWILWYVTNAEVGASEPSGTTTKVAKATGTQGNRPH